MTRMYYFMLHLSLADILTALLTLLSELIWTLTSPNFYGGNFVCKVVKFLQMIGPYLSSYILVMTAVDRYQAICHPLTNQVWAGKKSKRMVLLAWVVSLLLCVPQLIIFGTPEDDSYECYATFHPGWGVEAYVTWFSISNFFLPLLVLIFCYVQICLAIWRNFSGQNRRSPSSNNNKRIWQWRKQPPRAAAAAATTTTATMTTGGTITTTTTTTAPKSKWQRDDEERNSVARSQIRSSGERGEKSEVKKKNCFFSSSATEQQQQQLLEMSCEEEGGGGESRVTSTDINCGGERISSQRPQSLGLHPALAAAASSSSLSPMVPGRGGRAAPPPCRTPCGLTPVGSHPPHPPPGPPALANFRPAADPDAAGISRAKMRSIQQTVVVILMYISCSTPFMCVQLWTVWGQPSEGVLTSVAWLFWLLTLNSVVNPFVYMAFNRELRSPLLKLFGVKKPTPNCSF